jgi:PAS domain S-box-containing protein
MNLNNYQLASAQLGQLLVQPGTLEGFSSLQVGLEVVSQTGQVCVVLQQQQVVGVVTPQQLLRAVVAGADLQTTSIATLMQIDFPHIVVSATTESTARDVAEGQVFQQYGSDYLLVLDQQQTLVGLLQLQDLLMYQEEIRRQLDAPNPMELAVQELNQQVEQQVLQRTQTLQASETCYRGFFDQAPLGIAVVNLATSRIERVNHAMNEILAYQGDELLALTCHDVTYPDDADQDVPYLQAMLRGEIDVYELEKRFVQKTGNVIWGYLKASVLRNPDGEPVWLLAMVRDITEQRQVAAQLQTSLKEKEVLLREIHHRVKNSLTMVSSLLMIQEGATQDTQTQALLQDSQERIGVIALVHELLYQSVNLQQINLGEYLQALAEQLWSSLVSAKIELRLDLEPILLNIETALPCGLILNELLTNAQKHGFPEGRSGWVRISLQVCDKDLLLSVSNNGVAIPPSLDIFQAKSLGLQLVRDLTRQLRGSLQVTTTDARGSDDARKLEPGVTCFEISFQEKQYRRRI